MDFFGFKSHIIIIGIVFLQFGTWGSKTLATLEAGSLID
jgi:hypothetical protein